LQTIRLDHAIYAMAFSPDGQKLAIAPKHESPLVCDIQSGQQVFCADESRQTCFSLAFDPSGSTLIGGSDGSLLSWDAATGESRGAYIGHTGRISSLGFTPDGESIISASWDLETRLWDAAPPREFEVFRGDVGRAPCVAFSSRQDVVVYADSENRCVLHDLPSGRQLGEITPPGPARIDRVVLSPSGRYLVVTRWGGPSELYDLQQSQGPHLLQTLEIAARRMNDCSRPRQLARNIASSCLNYPVARSSRLRKKTPGR